MCGDAQKLHRGWAIVDQVAAGLALLTGLSRTLAQFTNNFRAIARTLEDASLYAGPIGVVCKPLGVFEIIATVKFVGGRPQSFDQGSHDDTHRLHHLNNCI